MHVVFAAAELAPLVKVGGLAEAATGLVRALRAAGHTVEVVVPDYGTAATGVVAEEELAVPAWAGPARAATGYVPEVGPVTFVDVPGIRRHHPYVHLATGQGWADNDRRFFAFSAAVAALATARGADVVHLNDWHTAAALAFAGRESRPATVLTIHNLAHQGWADQGWLAAFGERAAAFDHDGACNPLAGAIRLADAIVAVSPTYAGEILTPALGEGLHGELAARADALVGIRNGIDTARWCPATDELLPANFTAKDLSGREICQKELRRMFGLEPNDGPLVGLVARLTAQKGVDLALGLAPLLETLPAQLVIIGDGDPALAAQARAVAERHPGTVAVGAYSDYAAHLVAGGADLMLVPSRFEPCGLTQMEAMAYGAIPVVTGVGGLADTVVDADRCPTSGTGFVAASAEPAPLIDALHRAHRAWRSNRRRVAIQRRGMTADWSWRKPAQAYAELYEALAR